MRQLFLIMLFIGSCVSSSFAQSKADEPPIHSQKFFFSMSLLNDSVAMSNAIPKLAKQVLAVYKESDAFTYNDNAFRYYMLVPDYKKAIDLIDSIQVFVGKGAGNQFKSYAFAKLNQGKENLSFEHIFKKKYEDLFNSLTPYDRIVFINNIDSPNIRLSFNNYNSTVEKIKKNNSDSISLADAQALCRSYNSYIVYTSILPYVISYRSFTGIKISLTAKTVLSSYQMQNYTYYDIVL